MWNRHRYSATDDIQQAEFLKQTFAIDDANYKKSFRYALRPGLPSLKHFV